MLHNPEEEEKEEEEKEASSEERSRGCWRRSQPCAADAYRIETRQAKPVCLPLDGKANTPCPIFTDVAIASSWVNRVILARAAMK